MCVFGSFIFYFVPHIFQCALLWPWFYWSVFFFVLHSPFPKNPYQIVKCFASTRFYTTICLFYLNKNLLFSLNIFILNYMNNEKWIYQWKSIDRFLDDRLDIERENKNIWKCKQNHFKIRMDTFHWNIDLISSCEVMTNALYTNTKCEGENLIISLDIRH